MAAPPPPARPPRPPRQQQQQQPPPQDGASLLFSILALRQQLAAARQQQRLGGADAAPSSPPPSSSPTARAAAGRAPPLPVDDPLPVPAVAFHTALLTARAGAVGDHAWDQQQRWTKKQRWRQPEDDDEERGQKPRALRPPPPLLRTDPKSAAAAADAHRYLAAAPPRGLELEMPEGPPRPAAAATRPARAGAAAAAAAADAPAAPAARPPPLPPGSPSRHPYSAFPTQRRAFDFWDAHPLRAHLRCFAVEHANEAGSSSAAPPPPASLAASSSSAAGRGSRHFLITSDERLWREYRALPARGRHHYEIIREGRPCHLYFDLEHYYRRAPCPLFPSLATAAADDEAGATEAAAAAAAAPPAADGARLVELLLDEVEAALADVFEGSERPIPRVDRERDVIELDSTRQPRPPPPPQQAGPLAANGGGGGGGGGGKFSRHLVVRVPGAAFADNAHAGAFVRLVCARLLAKAARSAEHAAFLVAPREAPEAAAAAAEQQQQQQQPQQQPQHQSLQLFIDTGVYTRNRAFRMYLSSKAAAPPAAAAAAAAAAGSSAGALAPLPLPPAAPPTLVPTRRYGGRLAIRTPGELFFDALVTRVGASNDNNDGTAAAPPLPPPPPPPPLRLLRMDTPRARELEAAVEREAEPAARLLLTPAVSACTIIARVRVPGAVGAAAAAGGGAGASGVGRGPRAGPPNTNNNHNNSSSSGDTLAVLHTGPSPYAPLVAFLEDAATRLAAPPGGAGDASKAAAAAGSSVKALARGWAHAPSARVVLVPFRSPFRWCGQVGRHHRSNGVFAVADLEAGCWYMRCYDPDCAGARSPALPLPAGERRAALAAAARAAGGEQQQEEEEEEEGDDDDAYFNELLDAVDAGAVARGG